MIQVAELSIRAGAFRLDGISFDVPSGRYAVLMGKTGSGKTTLLETICGLRRPAAGRICLDGNDVTGRKPAERGIGYVPQDGALFTTMTVRDHLAFALAMRSWPKRAIAERVEELAEILRLRPLLGRKPRGLSGGEQRRVALGRALASRPATLLLDEPLTALDDETREEMVGVLKAVRQHAGVTALHVTHYRQDAERLADVVLRINDGVIETQTRGNNEAR
jgi:ABC-type sugar transport system ATPase subunit